MRALKDISPAPLALKRRKAFEHARAKAWRTKLVTLAALVADVAEAPTRFEALEIFNGLSGSCELTDDEHLIVRTIVGELIARKGA